MRYKHIAKNDAVERTIGCVVYPAAEIAETGVIRHIEGERFSIGEIDGAKTERIQILGNVLKKAGLKAPIRNQIRSDLWVKLWGNVAFNPISALTRTTLDKICHYSLRDFQIKKSPLISCGVGIQANTSCLERAFSAHSTNGEFNFCKSLTRELAVSIMTETQTIAQKLGIDFGISLEQRIAGAEKVGAYKTSMLQDIC